MSSIPLPVAAAARRTPLHYTRTAIVLHWLAAALILANIALGLRMEHFPGFAHASPQWNGILFWHASIGAAVLWLAVARWVWRVRHPAPALPASVPAPQARAAHAVHVVLYEVMIALPLSGYVHRLAGNHAVSFLGWFDWPSLVSASEPLRLATMTVHITLASLLGGLVLAHVGAVLKHWLIDRDGVARRMNWR